MFGTEAETLGSFTYQSDSVVKTLLSTGNIYLSRDSKGTDEKPVGLENCDIQLPVFNGRLIEANLDLHGFTFLQHKIHHIDYYDEEEIIGKYYNEVCDTIRKQTGAFKVVAFDHNVRASITKSWMNEDGNERVEKKIKGGSNVQSPAMIVHNDYTVTSAPLRLEMLAQPPKVNDTWKRLRLDNAPLIDPEELQELLKGRYVFINMWRNISEEPLQDSPLALCDATTISPQEIVTFEIRYPDRIGENYFSCFSPAHKWVYYPNMTKDEALLIKVWDSKGDLGRNESCRDSQDSNMTPSADESKPTVKLSTFSFHSAFKDINAAADCPKRESIEIRTVAFFS